MTQFKDGSFYVWGARNFALLRSFTTPGAPQLRVLQRVFAVSPDGQLLVSGGGQLPVLLVYRYGLLIGNTHSGDVAYAYSYVCLPYYLL